MWWTRISEPRDVRIERAPVSGAAAFLRSDAGGSAISYFLKSLGEEVAGPTTARGLGRGLGLTAQDG